LNFNKSTFNYLFDYFAPMKRMIVFLLIAVSISGNAQVTEYRSAENTYYWKNRKPFGGYWQQDVHYNIKAEVNAETDVISGDLVLTYYNNSPDTLSHLFFHLYQNAFVKGGYLENLNRANHFYQKFGKYETDGKGTEIESVEITSSQPPPEILTEDGVQRAVDPIVSKYQVTPQIDFSIMRLNLEQHLLPNNAITIRIKFKTYFDDGGNQRRRMKMFNAYGYKHYDGVHWYPRICVYDRKFGWETDQHLGKEFYGDFGTFDVALTLPNHFVLDATGVLVNREEVLPSALREKLNIKNFAKKPLYEAPSVITEPDGTKKTWKFRAINVHDFAWTADPTYRIGETILKLPGNQEVSCISLVQEPHASRWQDAADFAAKVIEVYSADFGQYAYPKMIVADARDGMEYPMLTLDGGLSPGYYGLFAHEIGHNWFFGMVGNNETYRASLDEGFTQFLTSWSMTKIFGENQPSKKNPYPMSRKDQSVYWGYLRDAVKWEDMPLNTHSDDFNGALHHGGGYGHVYYKTATMLYNLQYVLGDELFQSAMQNYFHQWKMAHPYFEDFRNSIINYTKVDLNWFFDQWIETTKRIDYAIIDKQQNGNKLKIVFERIGEMQMPIDFTVITKDNKRFNYTIPNTYFVKKTDATILPIWRGWGLLNPTYETTIEVNGKVKDIRIDTTYRLADVYQPNNSWRPAPIFIFDKGKTLPPNRKKYITQWRPDLWYNSIDGVKTGLHIEGNYMQTKDVFSATVWYNTTLANDYKGTARNYLDFTFNYRDLIGKRIYSNLEIRSLDGLSFGKFGFDFLAKKNSLIEVYIKGLNRVNFDDRDYLLYTNEWIPNRRNNTINIVLTQPYKMKNGFGELKHGLRTSIFADYDYSALYFQWIHHHDIAKFEWHSRAYVHIIDGSNIAPESKLFLAGANPEELMDNKFLRSRAFVPTSWLGYGNTYNHLQQGGGLNIRGYAGYLVPRELNNGPQTYLYAGNAGLSFSAELDYDKCFNFKPRGIANYLHVDAYLFGDAGMLDDISQDGQFGMSTKPELSTGLMASAGAGFAFTIKKWGSIDKAKPLTIRFDMPLYLSNSPFVESKNFNFRWVMGINRSF
jgi:hypothetical protein